MSRLTVTNITGSELSEVWGDAFTKPKKKRGDNVCQSLVKKPPPFDDIMNDFYHPSIQGTYEKSRDSRNQNALPGTDTDEEREEGDKFVEVGSSNATPTPTDATNTAAKENFTEPKYLMMLNDDREKRYLDLSMYVFSGVALIFILEQFIHLGLLLKS